jgi:hypothetical protein
MQKIVMAVLCAALAQGAAADEKLMRFSSRNMGITAFDLTVTEVRREPRKSFLVVPGFDQRTAVGSRWLMCTYTALAVERGYRYWTIAHTEGDDRIVVGFPDSATEDPERLGPEFVGKKAGRGDPVSVDIFTRFCHSAFGALPVARD